MGGRYADGHRRRQLFRRVLAEEDRCWLCGLPVDRSLRGIFVTSRKGRRTPHPGSPTLDEVVPVSKGGDPLDRENVRLAHRFCNLYRGDRMDVGRVRAELRAGGKARSQVEPRAETRASRDWLS